MPVVLAFDRDAWRAVVLEELDDGEAFDRYANLVDEYREKPEVAVKLFAAMTKARVLELFPWYAARKTPTFDLTGDNDSALHRERSALRP